MAGEVVVGEIEGDADIGEVRAPISAIAPGLPVPLLVRCRDTCRLHAGGELVDTIDVSSLGLSLGRLVMRLRPEPA